MTNKNVFLLVIALFLCAFLTSSCSTEVIAGPKERSAPAYLTPEEAQATRVYQRSKSMI